MSTELEALETRLAMAERVCLLVGWSLVIQTTRGDAASQAWMEWAALVGHEFTSPAAHPELSDAEVERLAQVRRDRRHQTLATFFGADGASVGSGGTPQ